MKKSLDDQSPLDTERAHIPRVLIADQSAAVIDRLAALIDDVAQVVGRATNARDALSGYTRNQPASHGV